MKYTSGTNKDKQSKHSVFAAKEKAERKVDVENDTQAVFCTAKQIKKENKDIVDGKCIWDYSGKAAYSNEEKKKVWKQHYERCEEHSSEADPVLEPPPVITQAMVEKSISKMKKGKAPVPLGVLTEMLKCLFRCL